MSKVSDLRERYKNSQKMTIQLKRKNGEDCGDITYIPCTDTFTIDIKTNCEYYSSKVIGITYEEGEQLYLALKEMFGGSE